MARGPPRLQTVAYSARLGKWWPGLLDFFFDVNGEPILVFGVIGPRSPTGLVGRKLTSCMLFVWPWAGSERRDVPSSMQFVSHTIPIALRRL